jgi:AhpD family alkylhydroperoxidase
MENKKQPKIYTIGEYYLALVKWTRSVKLLIRNRKQEIISQDFVERLMLAVTEVNGCAVCAYGHTQMALNQGFTQDEISAFLSGSGEYIRPEEMKAILFAQHYADTKGIVDEQAFQEIITTYGNQSSRVILAAIQMMMIGNIVGLPISAFQRRRKGNPDSNSSLIHEIGLPLSTLILIIPALINGLIETMMNQPSLRYSVLSN